jgi:hypothetical protein
MRQILAMLTLGGFVLNMTKFEALQAFSDEVEHGIYQELL